MKARAMAKLSSSTEPLYLSKLGLWAEADGAIFWLKHASGCFCGLGANGPLKWQFEARPEHLKLTPLAEQPVKVRPLLGELLEELELKASLPRRAPGRVRPNSFQATQNSAVYSLFDYLDLRITSTLATPRDFMVYPETTLTLDILAPVSFQPRFFTELTPRLARDSWELQRLMSAADLDVCALLDLLHRYKIELKPETQKRVYLALAEQFTRDRAAARFKSLPPDSQGLSHLAGRWAQLAWWQANLLAAHLVLEGLELSSAPAYRKPFRPLSDFVVNPPGDSAWVYKETWFQRFGRGEFSERLQSIDRHALEVKVSRLVQTLAQNQPKD